MACFANDSGAFLLSGASSTLSRKKRRRNADAINAQFNLVIA